MDNRIDGELGVVAKDDICNFAEKYQFCMSWNCRNYLYEKN